MSCPKKQTTEIARKVVADLQDKDLNAELLVSEDDDTSLLERVRRINAHCLALGKKNVIVCQYSCERSWKRHEMA